MSFNYQPTAVTPVGEAARATFIRRTYLHLAGAILAFIAVEALLMNSPLAPELLNLMAGGRYSWLIVLAAFMGVSWLAEHWARSDAGPGLQYLGLGLYVVAQAVIIMPLLYIVAFVVRAPQLIPTAGLITGLLFAGLTFCAFTSGKDFSFLRSALVIGGFVALGVIAASLIFGFNLGVIFSGAMVIFAGAAILYQTSNILRHYRTDQHVAAALALFASVALLFFYILRLASRR